MHYQTHFTLDKERVSQLNRRSSIVIGLVSAVFVLIGLIFLIAKGADPDSGESLLLLSVFFLLTGVGLFLLFLAVPLSVRKTFARGGVQVIDCDFNDLTFEIALSWTGREMKTVLRGNYYFISSVVEFDDRWQIYYDGKVFYNILKGNALRFLEREVLPAQEEVSSTEGEVLPTQEEAFPAEAEILPVEGEKSSVEREILATDEEFSAFLKEKLKEKYTVKIKKKP